MADNGVCKFHSGIEARLQSDEHLWDTVRSKVGWKPFMWIIGGVASLPILFFAIILTTQFEIVKTTASIDKRVAVIESSIKNMKEIFDAKIENTENKINTLQNRFDVRK